jgi:hypothetical protein
MGAGLGRREQHVDRQSERRTQVLCQDFATTICEGPHQIAWREKQEHSRISPSGIVAVLTNGAFFPKHPGDRGPFFIFVGLLPTAVLVALLQSAITTLPFAVAGGYVIDRLPGQRVMLYLGTAIAAVAVVVGAVQVLAQSLFGVDASRGYLPFLLGILGWAVGLWASGFPRLVMASRPLPARESQ